MLAPGDVPADFTLTAHDGASVRWSDLRGRKVVVFFYPKADTPGCTKEACAFTSLAASFAERGVEVLGVSADTVKRQAGFASKYGLSMRLLADPDRVILEPWGVWAEKKNYGKSYMGIVRTTYLFDEAGAVARVWSPVKVEGHAEAVLAAIDA